MVNKCGDLKPKMRKVLLVRGEENIFLWESGCNSNYLSPYICCHQGSILQTVLQLINCQIRDWVLGLVQSWPHFRCQGWKLKYIRGAVIEKYSCNLPKFTDRKQLNISKLKSKIEVKMESVLTQASLCPSSLWESFSSDLTCFTISAFFSVVEFNWRA